MEDSVARFFRGGSSLDVMVNMEKVAANLNALSTSWDGMSTVHSWFSEIKQ